MSDPLQSPDLSRAVMAGQLHLQLPSRPEWIGATVEYLRQHALLAGVCSETRAGKLLVALHEALSNAIVHGNLEIPSSLKEEADDAFMKLLVARTGDPAYCNRVVDIFVTYDGERCQWAITDQGRGFDFAGYLQRLSSDDSEILLSSGRGLLLMRTFMDEVQFEAGGRRVVLTLLRASGEEKRQAPRFPLHAPVEVVPLQPDGSINWRAAWSAVLRNLSRGGLSLLQTGLAECDRILIGLPVGDQPVYLPAEVRHWRALGNNMVELGCRFVTDNAGSASPATPSEVESAIGQILDRGSRPQLRDDERRAHPRVMYTERIQIVTKAGQAPLVGYSRDLSRGGIAFLTTNALPPEITILFSSSGGEPPLRLRSRVVRCTKVQEGFFDIGAQFLSLAKEGEE